jgi:hypothetical protein
MRNRGKASRYGATGIDKSVDADRKKEVIRDA